MPFSPLIQDMMNICFVVLQTAIYFAYSKLFFFICVFVFMPENMHLYKQINTSFRHNLNQTVLKVLIIILIFDSSLAGTSLFTLEPWAHTFLEGLVEKAYIRC